MVESESIPGLLFTAFEPSGDQLAAPVIARLKSLRPELPIHAIGGPLMAAAGATLIETTGHKAVMMLGAISHAMEHRRRIKRLRQWLMTHPLAGHVPVDSPAANWSICSLIRSTKPAVKIMHLVTPQIWAWGGWRIRKLRRLTDHVLCILPFEPAWLKERGVKGTFVGHPLFEREASAEADALQADRVRAALPDGEALKSSAPPLNLALLPGSRVGEHQRNWPTMFQVYESLAARHANLTGTVAAIDEQTAARLRAMSPGQWPQSLAVQVGAVDQVLAGCDVALVVSGTATLHTAVFQRPMVVLYNANWWTWQLLGRWLVRTRTFSLPNLIAQAQAGLPPGPRNHPRIVPEFAPHFGAVLPVLQSVELLLMDPQARERQTAALRAVGEPFRGLHFAQRAAETILAETAMNSRP